MDSLTQAVLGGSITGVALHRFLGRKSVFLGAALATLPDLDIFVRYADPISSMTYHRGFTHSLFVLTAFAIVLTVLWRLWRPHTEYSTRRLFLALWLCLITHPLLDAFTSFGTQLWWPTNVIPTSWSSIFIIDPLYTLPLCVGAFAGLFFRPKPTIQRLMGWGLILSTAYLGWTVGAKFWAEHRAKEHPILATHEIMDVFSTPMPMNSLLWRVVVRTKADEDCEIIVSLLDSGPKEALCLPHQRHYGQWVQDHALLQRLEWFSGGWLRYDPTDGVLVVTDLRMGVGPGNNSFRFAVAELDPEDHWQHITPYRWPGITDYSELKHVMQRVYQPNPPLPLERWASEAKLKTTSTP
ncbi:MAG TPA: metal-dependent hydrolase [Paenalcaligenes sp.]|nr:metal-dependent hydrolase [Paenalcaligenes sp.]